MSARDSNINAAEVPSDAQGTETAQPPVIETPPTETPPPETPPSPTESTQAENGASVDKSQTSESTAPASTDVDIDLTELNATMLYPEVLSMLMEPDGYTGKTVKIKGIFSAYKDESSGEVHTGCIISDVTACCGQIVEFVLKDAMSPDDYPELSAEITVVGTLEVITADNGYQYCLLVDANLLC